MAGAAAPVARPAATFGVPDAANDQSGPTGERSVRGTAGRSAVAEQAGGRPPCRGTAERRATERRTAGGSASSGSSPTGITARRRKEPQKSIIGS